MPKPQLSIVIPCYNEAQNLPLILERFSEVIGDLNAELILVNNGSTDTSQKIIKKELQKAKYSFAKTVLIPKNIGYGHGIVTGLKHCRADMIAYSHADMQCDPFDIIRGYRILSKQKFPEKYLIKGKRRQRKIIPKLLTGCFHIIATALFLKIYPDINGQPKVFRREFLNKLYYPPLDFNLDFYILYKAKKEKMKILNLLVDFPERQYGESKWAFSHLSKLKTIHNYIRYLFKLKFLGERKSLKK